MSTNILLTDWWRGFFYFGTFFLIHVIVWRRRTPQHPLYAMLLIFLVVPSLIYFSAFWANWIGWQWLSAYVLHLFLSLNYIAAYPAMEARSPTIELLYEMHHQQIPFTREQAVLCMGQEKSVQSRIEDLVHAKLIFEYNGVYALTKKGRLLADLFITYRKWLGEPLGQG